MINDPSQLVQRALENGATHAALLSPDAVEVEGRLAAFCRDPRCPFFGQSMSCPPNVSGPATFREKLTQTQYALVLRLEVDTASLIGEERQEVFKVLQQIVSETEFAAKSYGFINSEGFAGGSCKGSLCGEFDYCEVLAGTGSCRNPDTARPSMSGYGVNVGKLMKAAGWSQEIFTEAFEQEIEMMWLAGLVLVK